MNVYWFTDHYKENKNIQTYKHTFYENDTIPPLSVICTKLTYIFLSKSIQWYVVLTSSQFSTVMNSTFYHICHHCTLHRHNFMVMHIKIWLRLFCWHKGGRDNSVGKSSASQSGDPRIESWWELVSGHPMHEWERKRLPAVKVILHQLTWLTGA